MNPADSDPAKLIAALADIGRKAGRAIMAVYEGKEPVAARLKTDCSPVTQADEAAEAIILEALASIAPGIPVIAEESSSRGEIPAISGGRFWLVDPLDGTKEFLSRNGEFTVNIALVENGIPVLGMVYAPALDLMFCGSRNQGATRQENGGPAQPIQARAAPAEGLSVVASRSHGKGGELDSFLAGLRVREQREAGSSLKFCLVAEGKADCYPRFGRTMEWDTAAGQAILESAGGSVRQLDHKPLRYGKPGFENPFFVARGRNS